MGRVLMRAALLVLLGGCNALLGIDDNFQSGGDAGGDGPPITNHVGVAGHAIDTYHDELGAHDVAEDLSKLTIEAYLEDETGFHRYPGTGKADGTFEIPDVPARDYYLMLTPGTGAPSIYHCTSHDLDLGQDYLGAAHPAALAQPSPIKVTAPAMQRFLSSHDVTLYTPNERSETNPSWTANAPIPGSNRLAAATADWSGHAALGAGGVWLLHHARQYDQDSSVRTIVEAAHPTGLAQVDGTPLAITTSFTPPAAPSGAQATIDVPRLRIARGSTEWAGLSLSAAPTDGAAFYGGAEVAGFSYTVPQHAQPVMSHSISFGDPFPADWTRTASVSYETVPRWVITTQHSGIAIGNLVLAQRTWHGAGFDVPSLLDALPAPQHPTLDGAPLVDSVRHDRTAPMHLAWAPVAGATYYQVYVMVLAPDGSFLYVSGMTATPELILPPSFAPERSRLLFGFFVFVGPPFEPAIRRMPAHLFESGAQSALLFVSATCGDGVVDPGEACDTMGESATCNYDCTKPQCGDGITNVKAHEQCDAGFGGGDCDDQCRRVVCGDHAITGTEECDDGNATDGDGCSAFCLAETHPKCGNGVVDPGEQCDDGNTNDLDACDNACHWAVCGDYKVSTGAGEECDDGNMVIGDGCNQSCRVERCGDGVIVYPEQCDDGNTSDGDGCSHLCKPE